MGLTILGALVTAVFAVFVRVITIARPGAASEADGAIIVQPSQGRKVLATLLLAAMGSSGLLMASFAAWAPRGREDDALAFGGLAAISVLLPLGVAADVYTRKAIVDHLGMEIRTLFGGTRHWTWAQVSSVTRPLANHRVQAVLLTFEDGDRFDVGTTSDGYAAFARIAYPQVVHRCDPEAIGVLQGWLRR